MLAIPAGVKVGQGSPIPRPHPRFFRMLIRTLVGFYLCCFIASPSAANAAKPAGPQQVVIENGNLNRFALLEAIKEFNRIDGRKHAPVVSAAKNATLRALPLEQPQRALATEAAH
jgi:hypothetical protein